MSLTSCDRAVPRRQSGHAHDLIGDPIGLLLIGVTRLANLKSRLNELAEGTVAQRMSELMQGLKGKTKRTRPLSRALTRALFGFRLRYSLMFHTRGR